MTVTIIGILTAIAIPQYQSYQAKGRTLEAKIALANLYSKQTAFFTAHRSYVSCLEYIGYNLKSDFDNRLYAVGFKNASTAANNIVINRGVLPLDCNTSDWNDGITDATPPISHGYNSGDGAGGQDGTERSEVANTILVGDLTATPPVVGDNVAPGGDTFNAVAVGRISTDANDGFDVWEIDQDKDVQQRQVGY